MDGAKLPHGRTIVEDRASFPWWSCILAMVLMLLSTVGLRASFVHITFFRHTTILLPSSHKE